MGIDFPANANALLTIGGLTIFASLVAQWLKAYLPDWRFTTLLVLGISLLTAVIGQCIVTLWRPASADIFAAVLIGFFGATVAVYGYETVLNLLGKAGVGSRKD